ncbi:MAG: succinate-semialdehyde dehydrogenase/glutarate-semialdehyde dehydrogenase [Chlamydiales bacterium]|jgi:succinate-semialdehyde dehydrogenase/glutarate-semialdehyde dehydrogenase
MKETGFAWIEYKIIKIMSENMKTIDPASNQEICEYSEHTEAEIQEKVQQVHISSKQWSRTNIKERSKYFVKMASLLKERVEEYARLMTAEMGKPIKESRAEVKKCALVCEYYAENAEQFLQDEMIVSEAAKSFVSFEPLGVVLGIMPWNFPFWQVFRFAVPTVIAGNGVLLKHAANVSGSALAIEEIFCQVGLPKDLFKVLLISPDSVKAVIEDDRVHAVTLTGSEKAGMSVASIAGQALKKTVLELGGSDPFIVLEDADLMPCVEEAVTARMINGGQSCIAAKRFIVAESLLEEFCTLLKEKVQSLKIGDPFSETTDLGPMAREDILEVLNGQVQSSIQQGALLLHGGERIEGKGFFFPPTILTNVKKGMAVYEEETFGPIFAIIAVKNTEEALTIANDSKYGLGASIWTRDIAKATEMARQLEAGSVFINGKTVSNARLPFGGIKKSGYGRELSHYGIKEFVNIKTIYVS